jgi:glycosyltransferase involved in cell wall biosynthesis
VALEALASGVPVIAADAGGFRESVVPGVNGFLVAPDDSAGFAARIIELAINAARRRELATQARATALPRDVAAENAELLRQYAELAGLAPVAPAAPLPNSEATCAA